MSGVFSEMCTIEGKPGLVELFRAGPVVVVANRKLDEKRRTGKFAVVHEDEGWVDGVHDYLLNAARAAWDLAALEWWGE